jgi:hypothetical protein
MKERMFFFHGDTKLVKWQISTFCLLVTVVNSKFFSFSYGQVPRLRRFREWGLLSVI